MTQEEKEEISQGQSVLSCKIPVQLHQALAERAERRGMTSFVIQALKDALGNPDFKYPKPMSESEKIKILKQAYNQFREDYPNKKPFAYDLVPYAEKLGVNYVTATLIRRYAELGLPLASPLKKAKDMETDTQKQTKEQIKRELIPLLEKHRQGDKDAPKRIEELLDSYPEEMGWAAEEGYPYGCPLCSDCFNEGEKRLAHVLEKHKIVNPQH